MLGCWVATYGYDELLLCPDQRYNLWFEGDCLSMGCFDCSGTTLVLHDHPSKTYTYEPVADTLTYGQKLYERQPACLSSWCDQPPP